MAHHSDYPPFYVTVDAVLLTGSGADAQVLVIRRGSPPYQGRWALPGGFVEPDEDLVPAALRELAEETGIRLGAAELTQLGAYGAPDRDPRHRTISIAHLAVLADAPEPTAGDDAAHAEWLPATRLLTGHLLAFDHEQILRDALGRAGGPRGQ